MIGWAAPICAAKLWDALQPAIVGGTAPKRGCPYPQLRTPVVLRVEDWHHEALGQRKPFTQSRMLWHPQSPGCHPRLTVEVSLTSS